MKALRIGTVVGVLLFASSAGAWAARYDYRDYETPANVTQKHYSMSAGMCGDVEIVEFSRQPVGTDTLLTKTRIRTNAGVNCQYDKLHFQESAYAVSWRRTDKYDPSGAVLLSSNRLTKPIARATAFMEVGATWGSATEVDDGVNPNNIVDHVVETNTLLGLENVTVPYGAYTGCLKIHTSRMSRTLGNFVMVSWRCAGIGEVKRIQGFGGTMVRWELLGVTAP